jgi:hypothetical protein
MASDRVNDDDRGGRQDKGAEYRAGLNQAVTPVEESNRDAEPDSRAKQLAKRSGCKHQNIVHFIFVQRIAIANDDVT